MKKQIFTIALLLAIVCSVQSQSWVLKGNNNVTDTSILGSKNNKPVRFYANNKERMRLTQAGNLGIGTPTPVSKFHVVSTTSQVAIFDAPSTMYLGLYEAGAYRGYLGSFAGAANDVDFGTGSGNTTGKVHLTIQASPVLTVDVTKFVGVGTITPGAKFHISSSESTFHGKNTALEITNTASGGANWYLRSGATGTATPKGGFSIANELGYWLSIDATGNVGVGTTAPLYNLDITGNTRFNPASSVDFIVSSVLADPILRPTQSAYGYVGTDSFPMYQIYSQSFWASSPSNYLSYSDIRIKENIKPVTNALALVNQLRPVTYDITKKFFYRENNPRLNEKGRTNQLGFVAQDIEKIFPQLVNSDESGIKAVGYIGLIPVLTEAIQEQQKQIETLTETVKDLSEKLNANTSNATSATLKLNSAALEQNIPNPFNQTTIINYTLPQKYSSAKIIITDKSGKTLKQVNISGNGKGSLKIDASAFISGAYNYSLYVNGNFIGSKQMILSK